MKALVVIEAPGKVQTLTRLLRALGYGWPVMATSGHFMRNPESLWPLAVGSDFSEPCRRPVGKIESALIEAARGRAVFVATDDDAEGDVIARDVCCVIGSVAAQVARIRVHALTMEGLREALDAREAVDLRQARQGDARRILDRLIGHTFSRSGAPAGRVLTPLLASARRRPPVVGVVRLVVPCADGGAPYRTEIPYTAAERELWVTRMQELAAHPGVSKARIEWLPPQPAWDYNALIRALCGRPNPLDRQQVVGGEATTCA